MQGSDFGWNGSTFLIDDKVHGFIAKEIGSYLMSAITAYEQTVS
jgi:hypothetical protein